MDPLVQAAADGSNEAWRSIVEALGPSIQGFARARGVAEPEELTQDVFLDAARNIGKFSGEWPAFRSWVFTIAYRRVADAHRRNGRRVRTVSVEEDHSQTPSAEKSPDERIIESETVDRLLAGLEDLKPIEKDVLLLRVVGELSSEQVAEVVGKSAGNVRVIQNRAVSRLRQTLEEKLVTKSDSRRLPS